jgi:23S rRNA pseudouridine1911/1915/1917 synthase
MKIIAENIEKKTRLDAYLTTKLPEVSRSQIQKAIKADRVLVNGGSTSVHYFLHEGDSIEYTEEAPIPKMKIPKLEILAKGKGYLVINKPAGMLAHQAQKKEHEATVSDWLVKKKKKAATVGHPNRPGIVHRLDRDTSGTMILATTEEMYDNLKKQFHDREIHKTYIALVHGELPHPSGTVNKPIGRSKKEGRMAARTEKMSDKDRDAVTTFEVTQVFQKYSLIKAWPKTGRTHQIRVHMMSQGNAIVGDAIYTTHGQKQVIDMGRIFLHASKLCFTDLKGRRILVESPLPEKLESFLATVK